MFYCEKCRIENGWPTSLMQSYGKCEMCDEVAECWGKPSKWLPASKKLYDAKKFYDANPDAPRDPVELNKWILAELP
jgi:hypothetical protein